MNLSTINRALKRITAIMLVLMAFTLLQSCKKCQDDDGTPAEPCPCTGDACIDEMMAYTYFLPGTWWVYEEQNSGARDSVYVYEAFENENEEGLRSFVVRMRSSYDGYNYYHEFSETVSGVGITRPECQVQHMQRTKTRPGDFIGVQPVFFTPLILNDFRYVGGGLLSIDSLYTDLNSASTIVYFDVDVCRSEHYEHAGFVMRPHFGVQRKYLFDRDEVWNSISYHIVQ